jgi:uncharacterized membrane protein YphA (DoxX/SURF4 family)
MPEAWSLPHRVAFRFGVIAAVLLVLPHAVPLFILPGGDHLFFALTLGCHGIATWFGALLGLDVPPLDFTGSGDQLWNYVHALFTALVAVLGALGWTVFERKRAHPRLAAAALVCLRYYLAIVLLGYGVAKLVPQQFPPLWLGRYDQTFGDMSPMGLLWSFMGQSQAYTWFAGFAEVVGSVLLLWRRTYVVGALILIGVMTNVVLLNFCYDVPVKLYSAQLLVMLIAIVLPQARRLGGALLGYPVREVPPRTRGTLASERVRIAIKLALVLLIGLRAVQHFAFASEALVATPSALQGSWRAERVVIDGVERPPLFTDDARWRRLIFHEHGLTIRFATDRRLHMRVEIDTEAQTVTVMQGVLRSVWRYRRVDRDHLVIDTPAIHAELVLEPPPLLQTRGFHWVQEAPFNR